MAKQYKHIFLTERPVSEKYTQASARGRTPIIPNRNRAAHSAKLLKKFATIWSEKEKIQTQRTAESIPTREGTYLLFTSAQGSDLVTKSLEAVRSGVRLLNIKEIGEGDEIQTQALVYVPYGKENHFIKKIQAYKTENFGKTTNPKNKKLVDSIEDVSIALLESLWTDDVSLMPNKDKKWCEAWLNINADKTKVNNDIELFIKTLTNCGIEYKPNSILFPERAVILINANKNQLLELMLQSDLLAEYRAGQETAGFWMNESSIEQQKWVEDLLKRLKVDPDSKIKVCILDSGVNNGHQLLKPILSDADTLSADVAWGSGDHEDRSGHGTLVAGLVGYGNFEYELSHSNQVLVTHQLCSVKILPPPSQGQTSKELWGDVTARGIYKAEIQNPEKILLYCMTVTSKEDVNKGRPSSWSGAIDNLSYGEGEDQRLIILSAGNEKDLETWKNYPLANIASSIHNPSQSWNALTVGAYTEKIIIKDQKFNQHTIIAPEGGLSPYSSTSAFWEKKWPTKPDVVFEGGNLAKGPDGFITSHDDLELLSTSKTFNTKAFDTINATSAAAAKASWFAAKIANEYQTAWPETIRGLMVHSASWTNAMYEQAETKAGKRIDKNLIKMFGYGVPNMNKALYSNESALTYITEEKIQPFVLNGSKAETNEIHFYSLPWPKDDLLNLGEIKVTLRITLSYFVEPGLGEIGWKDKYRYQSFGLRFDINKVGELETDFKKRINIAAREEDEVISGGSDSERWIIGPNNRSNGSIHSDFWEGTAAELSTCNLISVFPIIGWWRERTHLKRVDTKARYSLIISLETPAENVELYTTVKNMIETKIEIKT